jgi:hypothetical protein
MISSADCTRWRTVDLHRQRAAAMAAGRAA